VERCLAREADAVGTRWREAALACVQPPTLDLALSFIPPKPVATGGSRERPRAIFFTTDSVGESQSRNPLERPTPGNSREPPVFPFCGSKFAARRKSRHDQAIVEAVSSRGSDRVGLASEAALHGETKKAAYAAFFTNQNERQTVIPAPRSDHLAPPDAATATLPGDYQPDLKESAEADSTTYRC